MGSSRVMGWLPLDDDCVRVILLFLRTGDVFASVGALVPVESAPPQVFAARASGLECDSLLESDWEERLQEQPRWARRWAQSSGARGGFSTLLGACEVRHHFAARRRALKTSRFRSERCSTTRGGRRSRRPAGPRSPRSS